MSTNGQEKAVNNATRSGFLIGKDPESVRGEGECQNIEQVEF